VKGTEEGAPDDYDPDVAAELYTTNGETTDHAHLTYGTLAWTPELDVSDPERGGGASVFEFQDSEADVTAVFRKNIPFALDVVRSADDPANPETHLGNTVPKFEVGSFPEAYGNPQTVEANVKREFGDVTIHWQVNGGPEQTAATTEWNGGERFGGRGDVYYHRVRGTVTGTKAGDSVTVWFTAGGQESEHFSYAVRVSSAAPVLILAAEDYTGHSPDYGNTAGPSYLRYYTEALTSAGIPFDVYDIDAHGRRAPDPLGVLSHYRAVIWYTGDDRRVIEPDMPPAGAGASKLSDDTYGRSGATSTRAGSCSSRASRPASTCPTSSSTTRSAGRRTATPPARRAGFRPTRASRCRTTSSSTTWGRTTTTSSRRTSSSSMA
jgi:hypothetical protein